ATVQRNVMYDIGVNRHRLSLGGSVDSESSRRDFHGGSLLGHGKLNWQRIDGARYHLDLIDCIGAKARGRNRDRICPKRDVLEGECASARADRAEDDTGIGVGSFYVSTGDNCPRWIGYAAIDCATECLRISCDREEHEDERYRENGETW